MPENDFEIIDFHSHHVPSRWELTTTKGVSDRVRQRWERINAKLASAPALTEAIETSDIDGRVVNIPTALFSEPGEVPSLSDFQAINDALAILTSKHGSLHGIASVDIFGGDQAAKELTRAIRELGLRGVFVESAKGDLLLDAPEARPVLAAAAELDIPVFVHPVNPQPFTRQMSRFPDVGTLFARGTINAAALISLIEGGAFTELPNLKVVVTTLAISGILLAGAFGEGKDQERAKTLLRRHVWVDTMGFHPALIRASVDLLGPKNVLVGSDWPIVNEGPIRETVIGALTTAGLNAEDRALIAAGNAKSLLKIA